MRSRVVSLILVVLLLILHYQLWFSRGNLPEVSRQKDSLVVLKEANARATLVNERLAAEVKDLKEGTEMVEERARQELGMVKPNEVLVQIIH